ncbi:C45 family autoproteolytic acyltransferase/hydolase [Desulfatiglans anilini]|uniref:C45 family autoproteolytic acyltransferase/hydolase n=1 Tax=Desulfatiglans anilini TaxID=90728 RepID=UPI001ABFE31A|nr:C45 family peptidase [Desulfatiglans anilini]
MHAMIWKFLAAAALAVCISLHPSGGGAEPKMAPLSEVAERYESGRLYRCGKLNVLDLHGSYRQMGRQYGHLLQDELRRLYAEAIEGYFIGEKGLAPEAMRQAAQSLYAFYPHRFKTFFEGMAETSGLALEKHILLNAIELYGLLPGCSGIAAWKDYTAGGPLVFGRNYDWFGSYRSFARFLTVTVFNGGDGIPAAIATFAGVIYATTGMNAQGLFLELNNGFPSGGSLAYSNRVPAVVHLLAFLRDCSNMAHLDAALNSTRSNFTFIINVADREAAFAYEWLPFDIRRRTGKADGLLVATNHFVDPGWGIELQDTGGFKTRERRDNLLSLAEGRKGRITVEAMMEILDTDIDRGGAAWPAGDAIQTVYQIIAVPAERKFWVKVPGFQEWTAVDLDRLFSEADSR